MNLDEKKEHLLGLSHLDMKRALIHPRHHIDTSLLKRQQNQIGFPRSSFCIPLANLEQRRKCDVIGLRSIT